MEFMSLLRENGRITCLFVHMEAMESKQTVSGLSFSLMPLFSV